VTIYSNVLVRQEKGDRHISAPAPEQCLGIHNMKKNMDNTGLAYHIISISYRIVFFRINIIFFTPRPYHIRNILIIESLRKSRTSRMRLFGIAQNYQVFPRFSA
jgi:hypothetical protein